jgi:hypothetical protein
LENWWNENWQGKPKYSEKTYPSATLSTTKSHMTDRSRTPNRSGGKPATNRLSYGAAFFLDPFRRLLRLAGSRWRYSTPPPHGLTGRVSEREGRSEVQQAYKATYSRRRKRRYSCYCMDHTKITFPACHITFAATTLYLNIPPPAHQPHTMSEGIPPMSLTVRQ